MSAHEDLLARLGDPEREHTQVEASLADPVVIAEAGRYADAARRYKELDALVSRLRALRSALDDATAARELAAEVEGDDRASLRDEATAGDERADALAEEIRLLLIPGDPNDARDVIVEIRGAEGGDEANLFARDLFEMYRAWASRRGWAFEVLASTPSELGGFSEVTCSVRGEAVWSRMKFEAGPHRVQRVPVTESQGRIHTSSATVTVLPAADEVEVDIDPNDLQIDVYRSSGPGGQSVNTTDSAVRITHRPTGVVVAMQDQKSQLQNKAKAMQVLRARLLDRAQRADAAARSSARRDQVGGGGRSEKIRTYNAKENRITDHRIGLTLYRLDKVLAGDLDEVSDALVADDRARRLADADAGAGGRS